MPNTLGKGTAVAGVGSLLTERERVHREVAAEAATAMIRNMNLEDRDLHGVMACWKCLFHCVLSHLEGKESE